MSDDLDWEVFGRLNFDQVLAIDFDAPVTRSELMSSLMAVHEALFAQTLLLQTLALQNPTVPVPVSDRARLAAGRILKKTGDLVQDWAGVPRTDTNDDE